MRLSRLTSCLATALLCGVSLPALPSGGEGFTSNRFASEFQVAPSVLPQFTAGNLGVLPASYWRIYQYLAYQAAKGRPLTSQQLGALELERWHVGKGSEWDYSYEPEKNGSGLWLKERAAFARQAGLPADVKLDVMGESGDNSSYVNCHSDAFRQAVLTLKARAQLGAGGKPDASHKAWLQGQDAVFSNCQEPPHEYGKPQPKRVVQLPPALAAGAPDWLKADHAYQTAAAHFYARSFDAARTQFQAIARDTKSPWQALGGYLAARSLIRSATLDYPVDTGKAAPAERNTKLALAKKELEALSPSYAPARQLVSLVDARIDPAARIAVLARALEQGPFGADTPRQLSDYLVLLDKQPRKALIEAKEPLTAWIGSMQAEMPSELYDDARSPELQQLRKLGIDTLRQRWLKQGDALWLAPLVTLAHAGELSAAERKAAAGVPAKHPLFLTLQYHLVRLAMAEKQGAQADQDIDRLLASHGKTMSVATTNRFMAMKMVTAGSLDGFLKAAVRRPDSVEVGEPIDSKPADDTDDDFMKSVLRYMPMSELKALLAHPRLPAKLKPQLQETMLARALVFGDEQTALALLDAVAATRATTRHLYARYRKAASGAERKLAGMLILVNTPELGPAVIDQQGRAWNWGCRNEGPGDDANDVLSAPPRYLGAEQLAAAGNEQKTLLKLPLRSEFMAPVLLDWAKQKPDDEEAPKALHFLVASTRMECPYGGNKPEKEQLRAQYSRDAFNLLHKNYPNSKWAKQTKYFF
ncbi:MAG: hypothetical protein V4724_33165 [Pseudomonadota bacterium]